MMVVVVRFQRSADLAAPKETAMRATRRMAFACCVLLGLCALAWLPSARCYGSPSSAQANQQPAAAGQATKTVGIIKAINGSTLTLTPDKGAEVNVVAQESTRVVRIPLGETTLKNATPVQLQDLQPEDRILVYGKLAEDAKTLNASTIVVMKQSDVAAKQAQDLEDWQKRGIAGVADAVDAASGTITIPAPSPSAAKTTTIHVSKTTTVRRYAPDSFEFEDAKPSTLAEVKAGDQVRARGARSADGSELNAVELVSGNFHNLAGTVISTDTTANTITVLNLATKRPLLVKVKPDSQLHKLPAPVAQGIAMRLRGGPSVGQASAGGPSPASNPASGTAPGQTAAGGMAEHTHRNGAPDLQQIIARSPVFSIADLQKGDAVQILSTEGTPTGGVTAIQLVAGVEPILQASPKGGQGMVLSPWSLGGGGGDGESQ
jgi:hypothetical protein